MEKRQKFNTERKPGLQRRTLNSSRHCYGKQSRKYPNTGKLWSSYFIPRCICDEKTECVAKQIYEVERVDVETKKCGEVWRGDTWRTLSRSFVIYWVDSVLDHRSHVSRRSILNTLVQPSQSTCQPPVFLSLSVLVSVDHNQRTSPRNIFRHSPAAVAAAHLTDTSADGHSLCLSSHHTPGPWPRLGLAGGVVSVVL